MRQPTFLSPQRAPERRPLTRRPRAPRPPGRSNEQPVGRLGRRLTRAVSLLTDTPVGRWLRRRLRSSCLLRPVAIQLGRGGRELDGLRIAVLSDLHVGFFFDSDEFAALAAQVSMWEPDVICLVGDLIDHEPTQLDMLRAGLARLRAREAVVAVPGNHEYAAERDLKRFVETLESAGVSVLLNRSVRIRRGGASLVVAGVDDLTGGDPNLAAALHGAGPDEPVVLLAHHPDLFVESSYAGVDLTLSGHTHGGQITWFGKPIPVVHHRHHTQLGYWHGRHEREGAQLLVGRGAGVCLLPIRIGARAEVLLVELQVGSGQPARDC
jgi:uncharacterized protein